MKKIVTLLLALVLMTTALTTVCFAWEPSTPKTYYVQLFGIDGVCEESHHRHWIKAMACSLDYETKEDGTQVLTGVTFTRPTDPASPKIIKAYEAGQWLMDAKLEVCQEFGGKMCLLHRVTMEKLLIAEEKLTVLEDGSVLETVKLVAKTVTETTFPAPWEDM